MSNTNRLYPSRPSPPAPLTAARSLRIREDDLPGPPEAHQFIGAQHGGLPISLFLVDDRRGAGPLLHRHPYAEVFVIHAGEARFEIDGLQLTATAGDILIAPAMSAHRFTNTGMGACASPRSIPLRKWTPNGSSRQESGAQHAE